MTTNPYLRALLGGLAAAIAVATPLVDDGLVASEVLAIVAAFLSGSGLTAAQPGRKAAGRHRADA